MCPRSLGPIRFEPASGIRRPRDCAPSRVRRIDGSDTGETNEEGHCFERRGGV